MAHGKTRGKVHDKFKARIKALEESAKTAAAAFKTGYAKDYKKWDIPEGVTNLWHVPSMHMPAWDRFEINKNYSEDIMGTGPGEKSGTVGDLISVKTQNDFMATEERAFRLRHASYSRCSALAHGRLHGIGRTGEGIFSMLESCMAQAIKAGNVGG